MKFRSVAICKIGDLLLRHFSIVFNGTTTPAAVEAILYALRRQDNFQLVSKLELDLMQSNVAS